MKCITVYTDDFNVFSDCLDEIMRLDLRENEELEIQGVTVIDAGEAPSNYIEKMSVKPDVVVMHDDQRQITILQHGDMFEIFVPKGSLTAV